MNVSERAITDVFGKKVYPSGTLSTKNINKIDIRFEPGSIQ